MKIRQRIQAAGSWETLSAIHCGGGSDDYESNADMTMLRDENGDFYIPAASVAGACRNYLSRTSLTDDDYRKGSGQEPVAIQALFGGKYASLVSFWDSPCTCIEGGLRTREGVRIESATGIAADHAKYNFEVLPRGSKFEFKLEMLLYDLLPHGVSHDEVRRYFRALLEGLSGEVRIGAKTRKGLGRGRVRHWRILELDMSQEVHVRGWLAQDWEKGNSLTLVDLSPEMPSDCRRRFTIHARLRLKSSILIRSVGEQAGSPDLVHLTENGKPLLTGTSLAGVLRHRAERIAKTMLPDAYDAEKLVESMFGPLHIDNHASLTPRAGRVRVEETELSPGALLVQGRVAIDRFTQGALDQFLFDEAAFYPLSGGHHCAIRIDLDLRDEGKQDNREVAVLLQAFKDLWLGDVSVGGEAGVGRGVFYGSWGKLECPGLPVLEFESPANEPSTIKILQGDVDPWDRIAASLRKDIVNG